MIALTTFDNREIAAGIWLLIIVAIVMASSLRKPAKAVLVAITAKHIVVIASTVVVYVIGVVLILHTAGVWNVSQIKATVLWVITAGFGSIFTAQKANEQNKYFSHAIKENFKLAVFVDFFVNLHVLPLMYELILIPISAFIVLLQVYSETDEKYKSVQKLMNLLLVGIGIILLSYASWKTIGHFENVATVETLRSLLIPISLSLLFLPYIFALALYLEYERVFSCLQLMLKDPGLVTYTKRKLLFGFHFRSRLLREWFKAAWHKIPGNEQEIVTSIQETRNRPKEKL